MEFHDVLSFLGLYLLLAVQENFDTGLARYQIFSPQLPVDLNTRARKLTTIYSVY